MEELEIFGRHTSYNVQKVLWLADELELNYSHVQVGGRFGGTDTSDFLQMNPMGKVPVLRHGANHVWESNTIVRYMAATFSENTWIATDPYQRSLQERWMDWAIEKFEPAFIGVFWGFYRIPPERRNNISIAKSVNDCNHCLSMIGDQLKEKSFLLGDTPSVADVAVGVFLHRLWSIELALVFPKNVENWYMQLSERSGYDQWVKSDFHELQGRSDY